MHSKLAFSDAVLDSCPTWKTLQFIDLLNCPLERKTIINYNWTEKVSQPETNGWTTRGVVVCPKTFIVLII